jgi:tetratricopeptide (TPR) repeat protein
MIVKLILLLCVVSPLTLLAQVPPTTPNQIDKALKSYRAGDLSAAMKDLDLAIKQNPRNNYAYFLRGEIKMITYDLEGALADTEMALKLAPKVAGVEKVYNNRGAIFQFSGRDDEAIADFEKAISINPNYSPPHNGRGVILEKKGKLEEALLSFNRAIELNPQNAAAYIGRGDIRFQRSELDAALSDFSKTLELYPDDPATFIRRGFVYGLKGRWELCVADLRKGFSIERDPNRKYRGILSVTFADLDKYLSQHPSNANAYVVRGFLNLLRHNDGQSQNDFDRAFVLDQNLKSVLGDLIQSVTERR